MKRIKMTVLFAISFTLAAGQMNADPGCGYTTDNNTITGIDANFCCGHPPGGCSKTDYSPSTGGCMNAFNTYVRCDTWDGWYNITFYPGTCTGCGCNYGAGQPQPPQWGTCNASGTCSYWVP